MNCPFCPPNVERTKFAGSNNYLAIYNIAPILPGHVLIVPKKHIQRFLETDDSLFAEMMKFTKQIIRLLEKVFHAEGFDFTIQDGGPAGQTIEHLHAHLVPRKSGDLSDIGGWYPAISQKEKEFLDSFSREKIDDLHMQKIVTHLRAQYHKMFPTEK
jgi:bis(5'-adenosyl)-triphosphatase